MKWLRVLGYDTAYIPGAQDALLVATAHREGRILLTKDRHILARRVITTGQLRALLIQGDRLPDQLRHVAAAFSLDQSRAFTLCVACGAPLRDRPKASLAGLIPPYVEQTQDSFQECSRCSRIYWRGTHWHRMRDFLASVLPSHAT